MLLSVASVESSSLLHYRVYLTVIYLLLVMISTWVRRPPQEPEKYMFLTTVGEGITKTCLYNFDPLKPHFYIVKLGFTGVYIIFLISAPNIDCGYSLEPPRRGGSNEYPQFMFRAEM